MRVRVISAISGMRALMSAYSSSPFTSHLLADQRFRALWLSICGSSAGFWCTHSLLIWWAWDETHSELAAGIVVIAGFLPEILQPVGGALGDRLHRPRLLLGTQVAAAATAIVMAVLLFTGLADYPLIVAASALSGLAYWPAQPVRGSLLLDLVGAERVSAASGASLVAAAAGSVSPVASGLLIAHIGPGAALIFAASCFLAACWALRRLPDPRSATHAAAGIRAALRFVAHSTEARGLLLITTATNLFAWPTITGFMPAFAERVFDVGPTGLGLMFGAVGLGTVCGAASLVWLGDVRAKGLVFLVGTALFGGGLTAFALSTWFVAALVLLFLVGVSSACFEAMRNTLALLSAPEHARGAVFGVVRVASVAMPPALFIQAALAEHGNVVVVTAVAGSALVLCVVLTGTTVPSWTRGAHPCCFKEGEVAESALADRNTPDQ